jgi:chorismate mutase
MSIEEWRTQIDEIDGEILLLLNMRARLALKVGDLKVTAGLPLCDPERESNVLDALCQRNEGPLADRALARIFRRIIRESRRIEAQAFDSSAYAPAKEVLR